MNPVKICLQDIVSGTFNNAEEARKMYLNNVYTVEQKIRKSDNITDCKKVMIEVYDQVKKVFLLLVQYLIWIMYQLMIDQMMMKNQTLQVCLI